MAAAFVPSSLAAAATVNYLRPNSDIANTWTVVGGSKAWEVLDDNIDPTQIPASADRITASTWDQSARLNLTTTSLSGLTISGITAWFYTPNSAKVTAEVRAGETSLGSMSSASSGWHSFPVTLNLSQAQLDNAVLKLSVGGGGGPWEVYASFVKLEAVPTPPVSTVRLRPNTDLQKSGTWTVVGAAKAWEALDDPVDEATTPSSTDRIVATDWSGATEVGLGTTSLSGHTVLESTAWFYTPNSGTVEGQLRVGSEVLGSAKASTPGWHSFSVTLSGTQSQLDSASLRFTTSAAGPYEVYAAFLKLALKEPPNQIYWGARIDGEVYGDPNDAPWDYEIWKLFEDHANKHVSIDHFGQPPPWKQPFAATPFNDAFNHNGGSIPLVSMGINESIAKNKSTKKLCTDKEVEEKLCELTPVSLSDIANRAPAVTEALKLWSAAAASYGRPFFFRWNWEMNGTWFQWGKEAQENPGMFVSAWRQFHDITDEAGANNVTWVWCPNVAFPTSTPISNLWPGSGYVDWTCLDGYNEPGAWRTFNSVFMSTYREIRQIASRKPVMIAETGSTELGGSKAAWISDALETQIPDNFPEVRAFVWFNWNVEGKEWPIETSPSAQAAFAAGIANSYYAGDSFKELSGLQPVEPLP